MRTLGSDDLLQSGSQTQKVGNEKDPRSITRGLNNDDPFGLWDPEGHKQLLIHALGKVATRDELKALNYASIDADLHNGGQNAAHYLADPGQDPAAARARAEGYISFELKAARGFAMHGKNAEALEHLGYALHAIEDASSPAHVDASGNPKAYPGPGHSLCDFCGGEERSIDITPAIYQQTDARILSAYRQVFPTKP